MTIDERTIEDERRVCPRFRATRELCLFADSEMFYIASLPTKEAHTIKLLAITQDMSESGMAVIVPSLRLNEERCVEESSRARVQMDLPVGTVELEFHPVRCEPLDHDDPHKGYLIGGRIVSREGVDYDGYMQFLNGLQNGEA